MHHIVLPVVVTIMAGVALVVKVIYDKQLERLRAERYRASLPRKYHTCSWDADCAKLWITLRERKTDPLTEEPIEVVLDRVEVNHNDLAFLADNTIYHHYGLAYMFDIGLVKMEQFKVAPRKKYVRNLPEWF